MTLLPSRLRPVFASLAFCLALCTVPVHGASEPGSPQSARGAPCAAWTATILIYLALYESFGVLDAETGEMVRAQLNALGRHCDQQGHAAVLARYAALFQLLAPLDEAWLDPNLWGDVP